MIKSPKEPRIYRHIFFKKKIIQSGTGTVNVCYTGNIYANCDRMKNFSSLFDRNKDLLITCNDCASRQYKSFTKIESKN